MCAYNAGMLQEAEDMMEFNELPEHYSLIMLKVAELSGQPMRGVVQTISQLAFICEVTNALILIAKERKIEPLDEDIAALVELAKVEVARAAPNE